MQELELQIAREVSQFVFWRHVQLLRQPSPVAFVFSPSKRSIQGLLPPEEAWVSNRGNVKRRKRDAIFHQ